MVDLVYVAPPPRALYLGVIREDINSFIVAPTELGALMGVVCASIAVIVQGAVLDLDGAWTDTFGAVHSTKAAAAANPHRAPRVGTVWKLLASGRRLCRRRWITGFRW